MIIFKDVRQVDLIIFPEMFTTGFSMNQKDCWKIIWRDSVLDAGAKSLNTCIIGSIAVKEKNQFYNDYMLLNLTKLIITIKDIFFNGSRR